MYRAVFVDDEPWVLRSLTHIIDWAAFGFSVHAAFTDPYDALDAIRKDPPDVVFVDIRMPGMTGLELVQRCKEAGISCIFIIATAYTDFEYAQEAIEQQVFSYVVKPFEKEALISLAKRLQKMFQKAELTRIHRRLQTCALSALLFENGPEQTPQLLSGDLMNTSSSDYAIAAIDTDSPAILQTLTPAAPPVALYNTCHILVFSSFESAQQALRSLPPGTFRAGLCRGSSQSLSFSIRASLTALYSVKFFELPSALLSFPEAECDPSDSFVNRLSDGIRKQNLESVKRTLQELDQLGARGGILINQVLRIYQEFVSCIRDSCTAAGLTDALYFFQDIYHLYSAFPKASLLYTHMRALLTGILGAGKPETRENNLREILLYVDQHYAETLTLEFLSSQFHISLSHLCRQFKKAAGMTFTEYLFARRMDKAMRLLKETSLSVAEICEQTGYTDYFYFNKIFKKYTGCTPGRYRKGRDFYETNSET